MNEVIRIVLFTDIYKVTGSTSGLLSHSPQPEGTTLLWEVTYYDTSCQLSQMVSGEHASDRSKNRL